MRYAIEDRVVEIVPPALNGVHTHLKVLYSLQVTIRLAMEDIWRLSPYLRRCGAVLSWDTP